MTTDTPADTNNCHNSGDRSEKDARKESIMTALADVNFALSHITSLEELNDAVFQVMESLPESVELSNHISQARQDGNPTLEGELVAKQLAIYVDISSELSLIAGIETDRDRVSREDQEFRNRITDNFADVDLDEFDSGDVLTRIGMLKPGDSGELVFSFPSETFPPHICEKWEHYIDIVARHVASEKLREEGQDNVRDITLLNSYRTQAHNNLSQSIKEFLNMSSWDLEKCRRLVIKMRDAQLPNVETAERETTAIEIVRLITMARTISRH